MTLALERRDGRPLRIGHRGAPTLAPENTLRSLRAALREGAELIEFDVLELADGELVVAHSDDLLEVSHGVVRGSVRRRSLTSLREVAPELPTFDEVLAFFVEEAPDTGVHLDLKSPAAVSEIAARVDRFGLAGRTLVSSTHIKALRRLAERGSGIRTGLTLPRAALGIDEDGRLAPVARMGLRALHGALPAVVGRLLSVSRATTLVLHHTAVSPAAVRRAHERGAAVVAWTVDDALEFHRVDTAGVDAVVTNDLRIFASTLTA